jgi:hypothetical protein
MLTWVTLHLIAVIHPTLGPAHLRGGEQEEVWGLLRHGRAAATPKILFGPGEWEKSNHHVLV